MGMIPLAIQQRLDPSPVPAPTSAQDSKTTKSNPTPTTTPTKVYHAKSPLDFVNHEQENAQKVAKIAQKYHSIDDLDKHSKIDALKDVNLNPYNLNNSYL